MTNNSQISIRARYTICIRRNPLFNRRVIYCEQQIRWSCCHSDKSFAPIALKSPVYAGYFVPNRFEQSRRFRTIVSTSIFIRPFRRRALLVTCITGMPTLADVRNELFNVRHCNVNAERYTARSKKHNSFPRERDCSRWLWKGIIHYISKLWNSHSTSFACVG